jgi:hypothetical protein
MKKMKYNVAVPFTATVNVEVEADSIEEAKKKALAEASASLCHQCSKEVTIGDPDADLLTDVCVEEIED